MNRSTSARVVEALRPRGQTLDFRADIVALVIQVRVQPPCGVVRAQLIRTVVTRARERLDSALPLAYVQGGARQIADENWHDATQAVPLGQGQRLLGCVVRGLRIRSQHTEIQPRAHGDRDEPPFIGELHAGPQRTPPLVRSADTTERRTARDQDIADDRYEIQALGDLQGPISHRDRGREVFVHEIGPAELAEQGDPAGSIGCLLWLEELVNRSLDRREGFIALKGLDQGVAEQGHRSGDRVGLPK